MRICPSVTGRQRFFKGLERIEKSDYPEEALREALLNALVHRDYSYSGSIIINVNNSCMEFISIGGLLRGCQRKISRWNNRATEGLAEIFHRLKLMNPMGLAFEKYLHSNRAVRCNLKLT